MDGRGAGRRAAEAVNVHAFPRDAVGRAVPSGVYAVTHNRGTVYVGASGDTAPFAVDALAAWWDSVGRVTDPAADHLLVLADGGGSNGCRSRLWKRSLQERLCDERGLRVTVGHYPRGCSKWNPIEHRLFGPISLNGAGQPLRTWETLRAYLRGTRTTTGLEVRAQRLDGVYPTGQHVADAEMETLNLTAHATCPAWNYTLQPRPGAEHAVATPPPTWDVIV